MAERLRILALYNRYLDRGGEDQVFESEVSLLLRNGCEVTALTDRTAPPASFRDRTRLAVGTIWSARSYRRVASFLALVRPDVVHVYNTFPLLSPSIYYACRRASVPVVQTVQNYRLICTKATLYREGRVCEQCVGRAVPWPAIAHACYHDSRPQTGVVTAMLVAHRLLGTWRREVAIYVAASAHSRDRLVAGGLPAAKIVVKPNFVHPDPGAAEGGGTYALFVGRLSQEKGLLTLLEAWRGLREVPLRIAGDGPLLSLVRRVAAEAGLPVEVHGRVPRREVLRLMHGARFLVLPSQWYEGLPLTLVEAFACGLPVVASRLGAMAEVIEEERTGLLFAPGDTLDLQRSVSRLWEHAEHSAEMGRQARAEFERRYTADHNFDLLMALYDRALLGTRPPSRGRSRSAGDKMEPLPDVVDRLESPM
jgi:glycosyltransferase involved in cell wall biosynthesis